MAGYTHHPQRWDRASAAVWKQGNRELAAKLALQALDDMAEPDPDAFIQPGFYLFLLGRYKDAAAVLERGVKLYPDHPMIRLTLGSSYTRGRTHKAALPHLERFLALGYADMSAFDALAYSCSETGDFIRAKMFGTLALQEKDKATKDRHGKPKLKLVKPGRKKQVIAFTLFGSDPRYLRGALQNVVVARDLYPGWTCRFYVDDSVDAHFLSVLEAEGAELVKDTSGNRDLRHLLTRRFLVADDPKVGRFMVRDCDSVVNPREAAAVAEWIESGLPFHVMRDWWTHTDPILAGMFGGIAGAFPGMRNRIEAFSRDKPLNTNWDQYFLRDQVWPAIRDQVMVHDRCYPSHRARPFPTPTPAGRAHVGQNEHNAERASQAAALDDFAGSVPSLQLAPAIPIKLRLRTS